MYLKLQMHKTESFVDFFKGLFVDIIKKFTCEILYITVSYNQ